MVSGIEFGSVTKTNRPQPHVTSLLISCFALKPLKLESRLGVDFNEVSRHISVLVALMCLEALKKASVWQSLI